MKNSLSKYWLIAFAIFSIAYFINPAQAATLANAQGNSDVESVITLTSTSILPQANGKVTMHSSTVGTTGTRKYDINLQNINANRTYSIRINNKIVAKVMASTIGNITTSVTNSSTDDDSSDDASDDNGSSSGNDSSDDMDDDHGSSSGDDSSDDMDDDNGSSSGNDSSDDMDDDHGSSSGDDSSDDMDDDHGSSSGDDSSDDSDDDHGNSNNGLTVSERLNLEKFHVEILDEVGHIILFGQGNGVNTIDVNTVVHFSLVATKNVSANGKVMISYAANNGKVNQELLVQAVGLKKGNYMVLVNGTNIAKLHVNKKGNAQLSINSGSKYSLPVEIKSVLAVETLDLLDTNGAPVLSGKLIY